MSKVAYLVMVKLSGPAIFGPTALISYYRYFTTDLGPDAFELPMPVWWVFDTNAQVETN